MIREEYLRRLVDAAHVELYLSGSDGARMYWPWRMEPPKEASRTYRNACEHYVIDSDPQDDTVTTEDVLDCAAALDAEVASLQDIYQDKNGTVDKLLEGLEIADDHRFDGALLLPLQAPFVKCYREIGEPTDHWVGLGGLKDASDHARIKATREFRSAVPESLHVHGFGWGPREDIAAAIRETPTMLDSLDYSTPCRQTNMPNLTPGDERMTVNAAYAAAQLIRDLREVTPYPDETESDSSQAGVTEWV